MVARSHRRSCRHASATSIVIFVLLNVAPGDPAATMLGIDASPRAIAALHAELGLDGPPLLARFLRWIAGVLHGDLGTSFTYRVPVAGLVAERLAVSLPLAGARPSSLWLGVPAGVLVARHPGTLVDKAIGLVARIGLAAPDFWLGVLLVLVFALGLGWFPAGGFPGREAGLSTLLKALVLPVVALAMPQAAILARITRASLGDVLEQDFIRTARAGIVETAVLWRHALPNAAAPVLAIVGLQIPYLLAGSALRTGVLSSGPGTSRHSGHRTTRSHHRAGGRPADGGNDRGRKFRGRSCAGPDRPARRPENRTMRRIDPIGHRSCPDGPVCPCRAHRTAVDAL
jgi:ABC-type dipeptide/oligopeptide/nickel transport system permease component